MAASDTVFDSSTRFLQNLAAHAGRAAPFVTGAPPLGVPLGYRSAATATDANPLAAYAAEPPQISYRAWVEGYGSWTRTSARASYSGDSRRTFGGVAGFGVAPADGVNVGVSVDQSRSDTDIAGYSQSARVDMTQIGAYVAFNRGGWMAVLAGSRGIGSIHSSRTETGGDATASYNTRAWGAVGEISYTWSIGSWRIAPKGGLEWTQGANDAYVESGGTTPVTGSAQTNTRTRIYGGLDLSCAGRAGTAVYDVDVYGKVFDIVSQSIPALVIVPTGGGPSRLVPGLSEAPVEFAVGASAGLRVTSNARVYVAYDGRFRSDFNSNGGRVGIELSW